MTTTMLLPSDDELRLALLHEPPSGLAAALADDVAREVRRTSQRRPLFPGAPWGRWAAEPGLGPRTSRIVWATAVIGLVLVLLATVLLIGAILRKPSLLGNGTIAVAPPESGLVMLDAGQQTTDPIPGDRGQYLAFSPSGDRLAFWAGTVSSAHGTYDWTVAILDARTRAVSTPMTTGIPDSFEPNGPLQWSSDGKRILVPVLADGSPAVLIADPATGRFDPVGPHGMEVSVAAWSSDGKRLTYVASQPFADDWRLWLADANGAGSTELPLHLPSPFALTGSGTLGGSTDLGYPVEWSPDSANLLITGESDQATTMAFVVGVADGSIRALTPASVDPVLSRWSPDGSRVAFLSYDAPRTLNDLYDIGSDGSHMQALASDTCAFMAWAPDASRVLFDTGLCDGQSTLAVRSVQADGTDPRMVWSEPLPQDLITSSGTRIGLQTPASVRLGDSISMSWQGIHP